MASDEPEDINAIRCRNLRLAVEEYGLGEVCSRLGITRMEMRRLIGRYPTGGIGQELVRAAERAYAYESGWMDQPHPEIHSCIEAAMQMDRATFRRRILRVRNSH